MTTPADIMRQAINYQLRGANTAMPGSIVSYDYTQQKAQVQPDLRRKYKDGSVQSMPELVNVPVIFPQGGGFHMHWPLNPGDTVLLVFSQRSMDEWLKSGGEVTPQDPRMLDLSDAIAIPGLIPFSPASPAADNQNFNLEMGSARMRISPSGQFCFRGVSEELMSILDEMFSAIQAITVAADQAGVPNPVIPINNLATFTALQARFNTLKGSC